MIKNIAILGLLIGGYFYSANLNRQIKAKNYKLDEAVQTLKLTRIESFKNIKKSDDLQNGKIFVMNLDMHKERWQKVSKQLDNSGLEYQRFDAVLGYDVVITDEQGEKHLGRDLKDNKWQFKVGQKYNIHCKNVDWIYYVANPKHILRAGEIGVYCSHYEIINKIANENLKFGLIFEDDIVLAKGFKDYYKKVVANINNKNDIDLLYFSVGLGVNKNLYVFGDAKDDIKQYMPFNSLPQNIKDANFIKINDYISKYFGSTDKMTKITGYGGGWGYIVTNYGAKKLQKMMKIGSHVSDAQLNEFRNTNEINIYVANDQMIGFDDGISSYGAQINNNIV